MPGFFVSRHAHNKLALIILFISTDKSIFEKIKEMNFPAELKYTKDHEWIRIEGSEAYIGITEFAQRELGDIVYIDINTVGQEITENDVFGTIEAVKTVSDLFMPVTATILELNSKLDVAPELVNQDPYGEGWIIKVSLGSVTELESLLSADTYKELIGV